MEGTKTAFHSLFFDGCSGEEAVRRDRRARARDHLAGSCVVLFFKMPMRRKVCDRPWGRTPRTSRRREEKLGADGSCFLRGVGGEGTWGKSGIRGWGRTERVSHNTHGDWEEEPSWTVDSSYRQV